ncbi:four helix bundle protein [Tundrisphaera lichenicola]|uniref:four helix bundle protein n=1 Tax=Tundrisphaera lichenicola TaxID=2029860 RepID=UPI003EB9F041
MRPKIERFEDLVAWQKARILVREVYRVTKIGAFTKDFGLASQKQRSAVSVMANIAEGFDRGNRAEFHQFLSIAKASCAELRSHLYVASDVGYIRPDEFHQLFELAEEVTRILSALRAAVARQRNEQRAEKRPSA